MQRDEALRSLISVDVSKEQAQRIIDQHHDGAALVASLVPVQSTSFR